MAVASSAWPPQRAAAGQARAIKVASVTRHRVRRADVLRSRGGRLMLLSRTRPSLP